MLHFIPIYSSTLPSFVLSELVITLHDDFLRPHLNDSEALQSLCEKLDHRISQIPTYSRLQCTLGGAQLRGYQSLAELNIIDRFWKDVPRYMIRLRRAGKLYVEPQATPGPAVNTTRDSAEEYAKMLWSSPQCP